MSISRRVGYEPHPSKWHIYGDTCTLSGCNKKHVARGLCNSHYKRWKKYGDPNHWYHGFKLQTKHPLYSTWRSMRRRCDWQNSPRWKDYGGRGIKVCDRWSDNHGFKNFLTDMGDKPTKEHQLDRIDNDGDYTPENCRWVTPRQNMLNQRVSTRNTSGFSGVNRFTNSRGKKYWRVHIGRKTIGYFETLEEAVGARLSAEAMEKE